MGPSIATIVYVIVHAMLLSFWVITAALNRPLNEKDRGVLIIFIVLFISIVLSSGVIEFYDEFGWNLTIAILPAAVLTTVEFGLLVSELRLKRLSSAFLERVRLGNLDEARRMLQEGIHPNVSDSRCRNSVELASEGNHREIVKYLLENGGSPNPLIPKDYETTALISAARNGNAEIVRSLIHHGANVNLVDKKSQRTALIWACANGAPRELIEILLQNGADPSIRDSNGYTALDFAEELDT